MDICINRKYGGFGGSKILQSKMYELGKDIYEVERNDPDLIRLVRELGEAANGCYANLRIVTVPDEATDYTIEDYDGMESIVYVLDGKLHYL